MKSCELNDNKDIQENNVSLTKTLNEIKDKDKNPNTDEVKSDSEGSDASTIQTKFFDDFDENWINESNFSELEKVHSQLKLKEDEGEDIVVACLTSDYAMQNVLLLMGLNVLYTDGMRIRETKIWALLCRACKQLHVDTTRLFCGHCGNHGFLRRVPVTVDDNNQLFVELRPFTPRYRGKVYSIPKPKGGRAGDLILCEDQLLQGNRDVTQKRLRKQWLKQKEESLFDGDTLFECSSNWSSLRKNSYNPIKIGLGKGNPNSNRWQKRRNNNKRK